MGYKFSFAFRFRPVRTPQAFSFVVYEISFSNYRSSFAFCYMPARTPQASSFVCDEMISWVTNIVLDFVLGQRVRRRRFPSFSMK